MILFGGGFVCMNIHNFMQILLIYSGFGRDRSKINCVITLSKAVANSCINAAPNE